MSSCQQSFEQNPKAKMSYHYKMVSRNEPEISNLLLSQEHDLVMPKHSSCAMVQVPYRRGCGDYALTTSQLLSPN